MFVCFFLMQLTTKDAIPTNSQPIVFGQWHTLGDKIHLDNQLMNTSKNDDTRISSSSSIGTSTTVESKEDWRKVERNARYHAVDFLQHAGELLQMYVCVCV